jgi:hypothetical protein
MQTNTYVFTTPTIRRIPSMDKINTYYTIVPSRQSSYNSLHEDVNARVAKTKCNCCVCTNKSFTDEKGSHCTLCNNHDDIYTNDKDCNLICGKKCNCFYDDLMNTFIHSNPPPKPQQHVQLNPQKTECICKDGFVCIPCASLFERSSKRSKRDHTYTQPVELLPPQQQKQQKQQQQQQQQQNVTYPPHYSELKLIQEHMLQYITHNFAINNKIAINDLVKILFKIIYKLL